MTKYLSTFRQTKGRPDTLHWLNVVNGARIFELKAEAMEAIEFYQSTLDGSYFEHLVIRSVEGGFIVVSEDE